MHDGTETTMTPSDERPRRPKGIYMVPNMITLAALFGGFYSVVMAMNGRYDLATVGIFVAMVLDSLDGRVARLRMDLARHRPLGLDRGLRVLRMCGLEAGAFQR